MRKTALLITTLTLAATVATAQMKATAPRAGQPAPATAGKPAPSGSLQAIPVTKASVDSVRRIGVAEAHKLVKEGKAVIVDVRSQEQYNLGHIAGSLSIPGSQLVKRLRDVPPGKMIITYCACSAEQSSGRAVLDLNAHGVKNAAAMQGGWAAWQQAGLPTSK